MNAPKIHRSGKKIPKKNIHPCPFRSVLRPSQTKRMSQSRAPKPIPHHIVGLPCVSLTERHERYFRGEPELIGQRG
jgi:hypothetical protein